MVNANMIKAIFKQYTWVILFLIVSLTSYLVGFNPGIAAYGNFKNFLIEMIAFIPLLFILIGLFDVWVPKEKIEKHIGKGSGIKGIVLVVFLAMLQVGPLYGAFPVAYILHKKGASARNVFVYLGAFSSLKLPMLGIEIGYLGLKFTIFRTLISLPLFIAIGYIMEKLVGKDFKVNEVHMIHKDSSK